MRCIQIALAALVLLSAARAAAAEPNAPTDGGAVEAGAGDAGATLAADPEAPTVTARADRREGHVGDVIKLVVTAIGRRDVPVNLPSTVDIAPFSVLDRSEAEQDLGDGRMRREFTLSVAAYEPGDLTLPPIEVTYLGHGGVVRTTRTAPLPIKIASLIANEPEPAMRENAPPVAVLEQNLLLVYIVAGLLAAALGAALTLFIIRKLRGRIVDRPGPPPRPAHEIALEKLDRLGAFGFLENADNRPFYFAVSEVIREYLGARYGFDSLELTTDELVAELQRRAGRDRTLGGAYLVEVQGWLSACDLVKYAKISPSASEARGALEAAIRIVVATRPAPDPVAPGPPSTSTAAAAPRGGAGG